MRIGFGFLLTLALWPFACATYREDLNRGQRLYEDNQYEQALALWRGLEEDADSLSGTDRARYAYLRGMTDYRLGLRADARHWLAISEATEQAHPGALRADWQERMQQSLTDLNRDVYGGGSPPEPSAVSGIEYGRAPSSSSSSERAEAPPSSSAPASDSAEQVPRPEPVPAPPLSATPSASCRSSADCAAGQVCDGAACRAP